MRIVITGGEVTGDRDAYRGLLDVLAERGISVAFRDVRMRLLPEEEASDNTVLDTTDQA